MRLTFFLMVGFILSVSANSYSQTTRLNVHLENKTITDVIEYVEDNSEFVFLYKSEDLDLNEKVDINLNNATIYNILDKVFEDQSIAYDVYERQIVLRKAESTVSAAQSAQQERTVTGVVTDQSGQPLPGVTVVVAGTTTGTVTNGDGEFLLTIPNDAETLQFSFVGMKTQEVSVDGRTTFTVVMEVDAIGIEEVVAVGYGTQKKVNLTGSVTNVDFENIANRPSTNSLNALTGTVPGMTLVQGSGQPGNDMASINIRGIGSINASADPLVIIDGVTSSISDFASLSPYEIKEISVLKDAASSAIYGSRAANGVILVTTKTGLAEGTKINVNAYWGMQEATVLPEVLNAWDNAMLENEARSNANMPIFFSEEQIALMKNDDPSDGFHNTKWADEVFQTAPIQNYNLGINTGTGKLRVFSSINYQSQEGILINTDSERFNLRSKFDLQINDHIKFGLNISGVLKKASQPAFNYQTSPGLGNGMSGGNWTMFSTVYRTPTFFPIYYNNGDYFAELGGDTGYQRINNPVMAANYGYINNETRNLVSSFTSEIKWEGFTFNSLFSYSNKDDYLKSWKPRQTLNNDEGIKIWDTNFAMLEQSSSNIQFLQIENYISFEKTLGQAHSFKILAGHTFLDSKNVFFRAYGEKFPNNTIQVLNASSADSQRAYGSDSGFSLQSFFGKVNYDFKGKYLFESNLRYDGSSRFAEGNRYGVFPSFAAGWRISEEQFMQDLTFLNNLKVRGSWGILGNQTIGANYAYSPVFSTNTGYLFDGQLATGAAITQMVNEKISWETTNTTNIGLDAMLFDKFDFSIDYFIKNTEDMLILLPIPMTLGDLGAPYQNVGKIQNRGWEFTTTYRDKINEFNYELNFNISQVKNEVVDINGQEWYPSNQIITEGVPLNSWYGYKAEGIFQTPDEVDAAPTQTPAALPGDIKYADISGIDGVPDEKIDSYDRTVIGNSFPELSYGFGGNFSYKNFDLNLFFQGIGKVDINNYNVLNQPGTGNNPKNWTVEWLDRWTPENPSAEYPRLDYNRENNSDFSDYWLENGAYLRLKNLELGYSFSKMLLNKVGFDVLRIYIGGQNLYTLTKLKHFDPERASNAQRSEFYPQLRTYQLGVNLTF